MRGWERRGVFANVQRFSTYMFYYVHIFKPSLCEMVDPALGGDLTGWRQTTSTTGDQVVVG